MGELQHFQRLCMFILKLLSCVIIIKFFGKLSDNSPKNNLNQKWYFELLGVGCTYIYKQWFGFLRLCEIQEEFRHLPYQAKRCRIADLQPLKLITSEDDFTTCPT